MRESWRKSPPSDIKPVPLHAFSSNRRRMDMEKNEAAIRSLLEERAQATREKDAELVVRWFAEDIVNFDLAPPLAQRGQEVTNPEAARQWFATWDGPIGIELTDLSIRFERNIAFCHGFVHMAGKRTDGQRTDVWARSTVCLEQRSGQWKIVHEHTSFPMLMDGSEKAATELKPPKR